MVSFAITVGMSLLSGCSTMDRSLHSRAHAALDRAVSLYESGDVDGAIMAYDEAIQLEPDSAKAYYNLGMAVFQKGDLNHAIEAYRRALDLEPEFTSAYNNLGIALSHQGDVDGAITSFQQAIHYNADSTNTNFTFNLAIALWRKGDLNRAIIELRTILDRQPHHSQARSALNEILRKKTTPVMSQVKA